VTIAFQVVKWHLAQLYGPLHPLKTGQEVQALFYKMFPDFRKEKNVGENEY
jgi:hypothetical protein